MQRVNLKDTIKRIKSRSLKENINRFLGMQGEPRKIALSIALGLFVGIVIPMGFQTIVVVPIALTLDCNIIISLLATLISNPFTIVPLYFIAIKIGENITPYSISWKSIIAFSNDPTIEGLILIGKEGLILIITGSLVIAIMISLVSYLSVYYAIINFRKKNSKA